MSRRHRNKQDDVPVRHRNKQDDVPVSNKAPINMGNIGFEKFNEECEAWETYISRLENYFQIIGLDEEDEVRRTQLLIHTMGVATFQKLSEYLSPDTPADKGYERLVAAMDVLLNPKPSQIAAEYKFTTRKQQEGESARIFLTELKKLAKNCTFKCGKCRASTQDDHLRQQFISGLQNKQILKEILKSQENLTLDRCVQLAEAIERASAEADMIQKSDVGISVLRKPNTIETQGHYRNARTMDKKRCFRCGSTQHNPDVCFYKSATCFFCKESGHLRSMCRKRTKGMIKHIVSEEATFDKSSSDSEADEPYVRISQLSTEQLPEVNPKPKQILLKCFIENQPVTMEYDTGASVSTMSLEDFKKICPNKELKSTKLKLLTYTGEVINPLGFTTVRIKLNNCESVGNIYILPGKVQAIFGREWMHMAKLSSNELTETVDKIQSDLENHQKILDDLREEFKCLFKEDLGKMPGFKGHIQLVEGARPIFKPPRPLPFALRDKVEAEIDRLEKEGVLTKVDYCEWGTPIVPIVKPDGSIRLCADYKITVNKFVVNCSFPIPRPEDIFVAVGGGKVFSTLDIKQAYLNIEMDEESALIQALSTTKGMYKVNRLMFGVTVAPAIWQQRITMILQGLRGVRVFYDDIIVEGKDMEEHTQRLREVLRRLTQNNLRINWKKCKFFKDCVEYLGHKISNDGISRCLDKTAAVRDAPRPQNITELRSWIGLVNYYGKFIENLATKLAPLYKLLTKETKFKWSVEAEKAFKLIKSEVMSDTTLMAYDDKLPLVLATDASPVGLGAVLSHRLHDGSERPIYFASRVLSKAERGYSQIDKEATAIFWALNKFYRYCYGRRFTLITDHKPLVSIFGRERELPSLAAHRMLRYAIFLQGFDYDIEYRPTKQHSNADALSRLPLPGSVKEDHYDQSSILFMGQMSQLPVTHGEVQTETEKDNTLSNVYMELINGQSISDSNYKQFSKELSVEQGCVLRGSKVIIPPNLRKKVLNELHSAHIGMSKMKGLARKYVWWPGIDKDIEDRVRACEACADFQHNPAKSPNHSWEEPKEPFERVHVDYAGPFKNHHFLLIVDSFSKWVEVFPVKQVSAQSTIDRLRDTFSRFGLPTTVVSDNGSCFTSKDFQDFVREEGIKHKTIAPYHPSSNGQVERYVQTLKDSLRKMMSEPGSLNHKINKFLVANRQAPNSSTKASPSELMYGRNLRTKLTKILPLEENTDDSSRTKAGRGRVLDVDDRVLARTYNDRARKWTRGKVLRKLGNVLYVIETDDGIIIKRHIDQLKKIAHVKQS